MDESLLGNVWKIISKYLSLYSSKEPYSFITLIKNNAYSLRTNTNIDYTNQ